MIFNNKVCVWVASLVLSLAANADENYTQFKAHGNGMERQNGERLQVDPANSNILYAGTRWNGLFKSSDAGATWSRLSGLNVTTTTNAQRC